MFVWITGLCKTPCFLRQKAMLHSLFLPSCPSLTHPPPFLFARSRPLFCFVFVLLFFFPSLFPRPATALRRPINAGLPVMEQHPIQGKGGGRELGTKNSQRSNGRRMHAQFPPYFVKKTTDKCGNLHFSRQLNAVSDTLRFFHTVCSK